MAAKKKAPARKPRPVLDRPDDGNVKTLSVQLAEADYQELRRFAYEEETKIAGIIRAAVSEYVERYR